MQIFKLLLFLPVIFLFLPSWGILVSPGNGFSYSIIVRLAVFFLIIILKIKSFFKYLIKIYQYTPFKYLVYFFMWTIAGGILAIINNGYSLSTFCSKVLFQLLFLCIIFYAFVGFAFSKILSIKTLIKLLVWCYIFILLFGVLDYISYKFSIEPLQNLTDFLTNLRPRTSTLSRVKSTFGEAGYMCAILCINIPIIYDLVRSKYRIFKNVLLNRFVKISLIPLLWFCIILSLSPIWLIFCSLSTLIYFHKAIFRFIRKYILVVIIMFFIFTILCLVLFYSVNVGETYLNRIIVTVMNLNSLDKLVYLEASLASRVISYIVTIKVFLLSPIWGVGFLNVGSWVYKHNFMSVLNIPITQEIEENIYDAPKLASMHLNSAILYNTLAELGVIGFILLYNFMFRTFFFAKNIIKNLNGIERDFAHGVAYSVLIIIFTSFYDTFLTNVYIWFIFAIPLALWAKSLKTQNGYKVTNLVGEI